MLDIRVGTVTGATEALALPVRADGTGEFTLVPTGWEVPQPLLDEIRVFLADVDPGGAAGTVYPLPRPGRDPRHVLLFGVGSDDAAGWRLAGASVARSASPRLSSVTVPIPADPAGAHAFAEAAWLATYRFRLDPGVEAETTKLREITLASRGPGVGVALSRARTTAEAVALARDLSNMPSRTKSPDWLAARIAAVAAGRPGVVVRVLDETQLTDGGFGGILAVGSGSARPPRLVELSWHPPDGGVHVVLVGKGITFDSGGISIKTREGMKLMRKDMSGAASVLVATLAAADLRLPVRVTALAALAENMVSGSSVRPGDVVRHFGGLTAEVLNTDAEGRLVLGDALAYAVSELKPDLLIDLATLTGAAQVALGKRTAALFTPDDGLAAALTEAGEAVGEPVWRMPLLDEYVPLLASDVADLTNVPTPSGPGAVMAALFLREFTGSARQRWAHIDMSGPSWSEAHDGILVKGATGWGVRMLLHWLGTLAG